MQRLRRGGLAQGLESNALNMLELAIFIPQDEASVDRDARVKNGARYETSFPITERPSIVIQLDRQDRATELVQGSLE